MKQIKVKHGDKIFVFKIYVKGCMMMDVLKSDIFRIIGIPSGATLYQLAETIINSFDFNFDHCFGFYDNFKNPYQSKTGFELFADIGEESNFAGVKKTIITKAFPTIKTKMLFYFDYGDEWFFPVELIEIREPQSDKKYPLLIEKIGESPEQYPSMEEDELLDEDSDE